MIYCYLNYPEDYYFDILSLIEDTRWKYESANEVLINIIIYIIIDYIK